MLLFLMNFDRMTLLHPHAAFKIACRCSTCPVDLQHSLFSFKKQRDLSFKEKSDSLYFDCTKLRFIFIFKKYLDDLQV